MSCSAKNRFRKKSCFLWTTFLAAGPTPILFRRQFEYLRRRQLFKSQTVLTGNLLQWIFLQSSQNPACQLETEREAKRIQIFLERMSSRASIKLNWNSGLLLRYSIYVHLWCRQDCCFSLEYEEVNRLQEDRVGALSKVVGILFT